MSTLKGCVPAANTYENQKWLFTIQSPPPPSESTPRWDTSSVSCLVARPVCCAGTESEAHPGKMASDSCVAFGIAWRCDDIRVVVCLPDFSVSVPSGERDVGKSQLQGLGSVCQVRQTHFQSPPHFVIQRGTNNVSGSEDSKRLVLGMWVAQISQFSKLIKLSASWVFR